MSRSFLCKQNARCVRRAGRHAARSPRSGSASPGQPRSTPAGNAGSDSNGWVMRFGANGLLQWERQWGDETDFRNIVATPDGGMLVYAHTRRAYKPTDPAECDLIEGGSGCLCYCDGDLWLLRLDAGGKVLWEKTYFKMSTDGSTPKAIAALADGTFVLSGVASEPPYDSLMLRFGCSISPGGRRRNSRSAPPIASMRSGWHLQAPFCRE
jgi:hypothetical protein